MAFYLAYLLAFYLTFYLAYLLALYLAVEVQRCTLSWAGPRLRSSGAHSPGSWQRAWRRVGKAEVEVEVDAHMVEEKLEEEAGGGGEGGGRGGGGGEEEEDQEEDS